MHAEDIMTTTRRRLAIFLPTSFFATIAWPCSAWTPPAVVVRRRDGVGPDDSARRDILRMIISSSSSLVVVPANAAMITITTTISSSSSSSSPQDAKDKENIVRGYERLQYLLDNWEAETTVCKIGQEVSFRERGVMKIEKYTTLLLL